MLLEEAVSNAIAGIEVSTERLREIANSSVAPAEQHARSNTAGFRNLDVPVGAFSEVPAARAFGTQHAAAHSVLRETILGVLQDLEDFRDNLIASANAHDATEDGVVLAMRSVSDKYAHHDYHSDQKFDSTRRSEGNKLAGPAPATQKPASETGGSAPTTTAPQAPTEPSGNNGDGF